MSTLYLFVGSLFSPFVGLISLLGSLFKYVPTKTTIVCFCFIISIIGIYWFPWGDAQSHFSYYYSDFIERYFDFSFISIFSSYWFYDWVIFQIASVAGNYVYGYMFWLFFPLAFYASAIWERYLENSSLKDFKLLFILLFVVIGVREFLDLNRSTSAFLLLVGGLIFKDKKSYGHLLFIIAICIAFLLHDLAKVCLLFLPLFYWLIAKIRSKWKWYLIAIISICLSGIFRLYILPHVLSERNIELYLEGAWGTGRGVNSGFMYLAGMLNVLIFILMYVFIVKHSLNISHRWLYALFMTSSILAFACFGLWTFRERLMIASIITGSAILILEWQYFVGKKILFTQSIISLACLKFVLILILHYSALNIHRSSSLNPEEEVRTTARIMYTPTLLLLDVDTWGYNDGKYVQLFKRVQYEM